LITALIISQITGRKENAEEAKKRILAHVERLADETSEVIKIPAQYHSSLIGQGGKYAIRLEEKYSIKITFPRHSSDSGEGRTREPLKADEVLLKGGRKGVAQAKSELLDALEFEKENNHSATFTIPTRAVAKVLGRGGATINEIKDDTGAAIDVEKGYEETTTITLKGTKQAISEAKAAILAISDQVGEETTETITIESKYHRSIIGAGGQGLRELIAKCDGPSDSKTQAGLIRFPRQGETGDEVRLRGDPKLVAKLKIELESLAATLRDRVILGVEIPAAQHRALIGRGGAHLNEVQDKFNVQIQIPGSRSYNQIGEPQNTEDLEGIDATNIVKVTGSRSNVDAAISHLKANVKPPPSDAVTKDITVPLKYHQSISQQGNFFRTLRSFGVTVDHSVMPTKAGLPSAPPPEGASDARIDDETGDAEIPASQWQVVENYKDVDEGDSTWTLKGKDEASLAKAEKLVIQGIENAAKKSHVGYLTLADRSSFPRIVGTRGANVARLRDESGADITVGRENNVIVIVGKFSRILLHTCRF
jgi:rRNA processing protein Krr1/Pno1